MPATVRESRHSNNEGRIIVWGCIYSCHSIPRKSVYRRTACIFVARTTQDRWRMSNYKDTRSIMFTIPWFTIARQQVPHSWGTCCWLAKSSTAGSTVKFFCRRLDISRCAKGHLNNNERSRCIGMQSTAILYFTRLVVFLCFYRVCLFFCSDSPRILVGNIQMYCHGTACLRISYSTFCHNDAANLSN